MTRTWNRLDALSVERLTDKVAKINARSAKHGFTGYASLVVLPDTWTETSEAGIEVTRHGFTAELAGEPPCYEGWRFLGAADSVDTADGASVLIRLAPGAQDEEIPNESIRPGECDHCGTLRTRTSVYLLRHTESGDFRQVGRSCLKDFLGHTVTPYVLFEDAVADELDGLTGGRAAGWDIDQVIGAAWAAVQAYGWVPSQSWEKVPTKDRVSDLIGSGNSRRMSETRAACAPYLEAARELAPEIRRAVAAEFEGATYGYQANVLTLCKGAVVDHKSWGLAVSIANAYQRMLEQQTKEKVEAERKAETPDAWFGTPGEKVTVTGTVTRVASFASDYYGRPDIVVLVISTEQGWVKVMSTAAWVYAVEQGEQVTLTGTVKKHEYYRDIKQTVLTRCKREA